MDFQNKDYSKYGFVTDIEEDRLPPGLNEDTVRFISAKKNEPEFMLEYRLKAFRIWQKMKEPSGRTSRTHRSISRPSATIPLPNRKRN